MTLNMSMGVNQVARASDAISANAARGFINTANTRGMSKRRTGVEVVVVIGMDKRILSLFTLDHINGKPAIHVPHKAR